MRLTAVIGSLEHGGAEGVMTRLVNAWAAKGWTVTLLTFDDGNNPPSFPLAETVGHRPLAIAGTSGGKSSLGLLNNVRRIGPLRRAIKESKPDLVLSFIDEVNVLTIFATSGLGVPVVAGSRIDPGHAKDGWWSLFRRFAYWRVDALVAQTDGAAEFLKKWTRRKVSVIPNPVSPLPVREPKTLHKPTIVAVARLEKQKNLELLIRAFARVAPKHSDWHLHIAGKGSDRTALEALVDTLGLTNRVRFLGFVDPISSVLREADIFALSSEFEGFPNALCEAMVCGVASIATDCPHGPGTIITSEVDGVLVQNQDEAAFAEGLSRLMGDEELRGRLATRGREITQRFALGMVLNKWETVFASLVNSP